MISKATSIPPSRNSMIRIFLARFEVLPKGFLLLFEPVNFFMKGDIFYATVLFLQIRCFNKKAWGGKLHK